MHREFIDNPSMTDCAEYLPSHKMRFLIADNSLLLMVMSRFGISLGFGDKTVEEICREQHVDCPTFLAVANFISQKHFDVAAPAPQPLMDYLQRAHAYFLDFNLPMIRRKLIEAIDCSGRDEVAMLILKFYDAYTEEVRRHMDYENSTVFAYVRSLLEGERPDDYSIHVFAIGHHHIDAKLKELKDIIIRYLPQRENNLLNAVLFDIINCEQDLTSHCMVEDRLFVPTVERLEQQVEQAQQSSATSDGGDQTSLLSPDGSDPLSQREIQIIQCVAQGLSNKETADKLCLSVHTVTTHRRNISQKLQIHSTAGLTIYAVVNHLVDLDAMRNA